jgi:hypothetical protein
MIMKQKEKAVYTKRITIRLKESEFTKLEGEFKKTTCRKFSDYLRRIMLAKPITITYRNASADAFLSEMIGLKNELSAIGKNFNQMVKKLHAFDNSSDVKIWAILNESSKNILNKKMQDIREKLNQIYEQWLQK